MMGRTYAIIKSSAETVAGVGLLFTPYWGQLLMDIGLIASVLAQVAGAIIGAIGVYKVLQNLRQ